MKVTINEKYLVINQFDRKTDKTEYVFANKS